METSRTLCRRLRRSLSVPQPPSGRVQRQPAARVLLVHRPLRDPVAREYKPDRRSTVPAAAAIPRHRWPGSRPSRHATRDAEQEDGEERTNDRRYAARRRTHPAGPNLDISSHARP
ncbi:hypothetical protein CPLU01_07167 [Colletotrichum plurivorum]|uniref:Uncharacterized protein n=1 Tax=Colletotrichum plurivorum TaxID=2175906 RepID=A0A8H6KG66_9PEZI|nr:hypothetical protein CPLU01_07167 [Colletotrichum plurivorum]